MESELYLLRRAVEGELGEGSGTCLCSLSSKTIVYKGLFTPRQLERFYPDLEDERWLARVAVFHHRFATNTLPSWSLAQPFRLVAHNGEINTVRGNRLWMRAREREMRSPFWGDDLTTLLPITGDAVSDSGESRPRPRVPVPERVPKKMKQKVDQLREKDGDAGIDALLSFYASQQ